MSESFSWSAGPTPTRLYPVPLYSYYPLHTKLRF